MRRHWYDPTKGRWEFAELPTADEEARDFLRASPNAEAYLHVYDEWRGLGAGVEQALLRVSALARGTEGEEAERQRDNESWGP
jgi:hypothetical protein